MSPRWVLHVDLDQFIAAVEVLRRPELRGKPVIVGGRGDPTERGVVATASYEARAFGVGSGMPLRIATRKCPDGIFLPVDAPAYEAASAVVMDTLRSLEWGGRPVVVEVLGWDEAFVAADREPVEGVGGGPSHAAPAGDDLGDPREFAQRIRERVLEATQLHCSVGIGNNKLQAKIATDFGKPAVRLRSRSSAATSPPADEVPAEAAPRIEPQGIYVITDDTWYDEMGHRPTRALWGIGSKTAKRLEALGIHTVEQLATSDTRLLAAELGPTMGPWFHRLGRGVDTSPVDATPWVPRAHGREETFQEDLTDWADVEAAIRRITRRVVADIDREGRPAFRVGLKIRFRPFDTLTRVHKIDAPTNDPEVLADEAVALLDRVEKRKPVRLLGVRLEMVPPEGGY